MRRRSRGSMLMGWPASQWIAGWVQSRTPRRTSTACCRRASLLDDNSLKRPWGGACADLARFHTTIWAAATIMVSAIAATTAGSAQTPRIVATTTDLASLAQSVVGDLARVDVLIPPGADPEAFEPRPSDLAKL